LDDQIVERFAILKTFDINDTLRSKDVFVVVGFENPRFLAFSINAAIFELTKIDVIVEEAEMLSFVIVGLVLDVGSDDVRNLVDMDVPAKVFAIFGEIFGQLFRGIAC
jgi:hypothetical protein